MTGRLYTTYQVAELLGSPPEAVVGWMKKGILPFQRMNDQSIRVSEKHLVQFLRRQGIDISALMAQAATREKETPQQQPHSPKPSAAPSAPARVSKPEAAEAPSQTPAEIPAAQVLDAVLRKAIVSRATDLVLGPSKDSLSLQLRIDGTMHVNESFAQRLPRALVKELPQYLLAQAGLNSSGAAVQKGQFRRRLDGQEVALEVTAIPAQGSWRLICHLPAPVRPQAPALADLLSAGDMASLQALARCGEGLILIAGTRRGGRDALLEAMAAEVPLAGSLAFAIGLSEPAGGYVACPAGTPASDLAEADVAVIHEIADAPAAKAAFDLARGGALVLAGIAADTPAAALEVLVETVGGGWAAASTLKAVVAVRSMRRLCPHCRRQEQTSADVPPPLSGG